MKVEIMLDTALKLQYSKLIVNRTDVYDKILIFSFHEHHNLPTEHKKLVT